MSDANTPTPEAPVPPVPDRTNEEGRITPKAVALLLQARMDAILKSQAIVTHYKDGVIVSYVSHGGTDRPAIKLTTWEPEGGFLILHNSDNTAVTLSGLTMDKEEEVVKYILKHASAQDSHAVRQDLTNRLVELAQDATLAVLCRADIPVQGVGIMAAIGLQAATEMINLELTLRERVRDQPRTAISEIAQALALEALANQKEMVGLQAMITSLKDVVSRLESSVSTVEGDLARSRQAMADAGIRVEDVVEEKPEEKPADGRTDAPNPE